MEVFRRGKISRKKAKMITSRFIYWKNIRELADLDGVTIKEARSIYKKVRKEGGAGGLAILFKIIGIQSPTFS